MPSQIERVSLAEFTITTHANEERILDVAERGLAASKPSTGSAPKEVAATATSRTYGVRGAFGAMELMRFVLSWEPAGGEGAHQVTLRSGEYLTSQPKVFLFIPAGPKEVPGVKHLERFGKFVREELEGRGAVA